jgi:hypothetical protein
MTHTSLQGGWRCFTCLPLPVHDTHLPCPRGNSSRCMCLGHLIFLAVGIGMWGVLVHGARGAAWMILQLPFCCQSSVGIGTLVRRGGYMNQVKASTTSHLP